MFAKLTSYQVRKTKIAEQQAAGFGVPPFHQQTLNSQIYEDVFHAKIEPICLEMRLKNWEIFRALRLRPT